MEKILNFIDGQFVEPFSGQFLDNANPATGETFCRVANSNFKDVEAAVMAAKKAFPAWSTTPTRTRAKILRKLAELIEKNVDTLALAESNDNGKPLSVAKSVDIPRSAYNFEFFADAITQLSSEAYFTDSTAQQPQAMNIIRHEPLGVVACISPWNLPLYLLTWKIAPALASGNCVIAKPSEVTPYTANLLAKLSVEAGLPAGVLNIVHGQGSQVGPAISKHPDIPAISFTGSTKTGALISQDSASLFKKLSLEMGGKNPSIIFADANFEEALATTVKSAFSNQGQICLCGSRIFIERKIYNEFRDALVAEVKKLSVGDPLISGTQVGALVSKTHYEKVLYHIDLAQKEGAKVLCGGKPIKVPGRCENGYFIEPTLLEGLGPQCQSNQEEIFGPVATLIPFSTEQEVIDAANSTRYGLAANLWTDNIHKAQRVSHALKNGIVWVNCWMLRDLRTPFGGMKDSGLGREGGLEALRFFTESKNLCFKV